MEYTDFKRTPYNPEPDFTKEIFAIPDETSQRILNRLRKLYHEPVAQAALKEIQRIIKVFYTYKTQELIDIEKGFNPAERFTEQDVILITYGDLLHKNSQSPLKTLGDFCENYLRGTINTVHILPFFPSSSDKGFSVIDYGTVDPHLGTWNDIEALGERYKLMFDGVINHVSSKSRWFIEFLGGNPEFEDCFIWYSSENELSGEQKRLIFRPRTTPVLTRYETLDGPRYVWTTFSKDQIDLNYKNPKILLKVIELLLSFIRRGADIIRLDAVTYLWHEPGTRCIHLEQTHEIIKLLRDVFSTVAPHVGIITETNVPHEENVSYFGNGSDEAHMVYNFALPPLVLHSFYTGNTTVLSRWAMNLNPPSETATFFNFLDSHDGIGLMGVMDILSKEDIEFICNKVREHGGLISYKTSEDGIDTPYELNITWYSAINKKANGEHLEKQIKRFIASRAIALVLKGVPGIYLNSLFGTHNDHEAVEVTGQNRGINRTVADYKSIMRSMGHPNSKKFRINNLLGKMIHVRTLNRAFHPNGRQEVLFLSPDVFAVKRISPEGDQTVLTLTNVSGRRCRLEIPLSFFREYKGSLQNILGENEVINKDGFLVISTEPYDVLWLKTEG